MYCDQCKDQAHAAIAEMDHCYESVRKQRDAALLQVRDYCATTERQQEVINGLLLALRNMKKELEGAHDGGCILPLRDMVNDALGVAVIEKRKDEPPKPWTKEHCQREAHCGYPFEATCGCRCAKCV